MHDRIARIYHYYDGTCVYVVLSPKLWDTMKDLYPLVFAFGALDDPDQSPDTIEELAHILDVWHEVETCHSGRSYRALISKYHLISTTHTNVPH